MRKKPANPTKGEFEVLQALWKLGPATVKQVHGEIGRHSYYTTTLKFLQIMTEKRLVERWEEGRAHVYTATVSERRGTAEFVRELIERFFEGSTSKLVLQALGSQKASHAELNEIRQLIKRLSKQG
jgi:BlaI family transcriptional regulator, penicillinase repressor